MEQTASVALLICFQQGFGQHHFVRVGVTEEILLEVALMVERDHDQEVRLPVDIEHIVTNGRDRGFAGS